MNRESFEKAKQILKDIDEIRDNINKYNRFIEFLRSADSVEILAIKNSEDDERGCYGGPPTKKTIEIDRYSVVDYFNEIIKDYERNIEELQKDFTDL